MSKSLGNLVFVGDLLERWQAAAIRTALLSHHYRHDWEWTPEDMPIAAARLEAWRKAAAHSGQPVNDEGDDPALEAVRRALDDDLDTPAALAALDELAGRGVPVDRGAQLLGITL
jgi:L-cysteine:1D-myo-inositol 2-amino-2-deoxy-alpha-D-glucopyranoside ligase